MRDSNLPKFLVDDAELFQNIMSDLFPGVEVPPNDYGALETAVRWVLNSRHLQQQDTFVLKVIQLYETLNVRFGVMSVGPTGGGKTVILQTLQGAMTRMHVDIKSKDTNFQVRSLPVRPGGVPCMSSEHTPRPACALLHLRSCICTHWQLQ